MRMLLAALGFAAAVVHTAAAAPRPHTVWQGKAHQPIGAFAQDGRLLAWLAPSAGGCNRIFILDLADGTSIELPSTNTQNVTCRWSVRWTVVPPVRLALAGENALWTLREAAPAPLPFDYVLGAGVRDPKERRFQEVAHASRGAGLWLGGIAGDSDTLVYAVTSVDYVNEVTCLSDPKSPGACAVKIAGGGIYRVVGRRPPKLVPGTTAAVGVAAAGSNVAYVQTAKIGARGTPLASAEMPIEVRDAATGTLVARVEPQGTPLALALTPHLLATLERTPLGLRLAWYDIGTSALSGSVPVPKATSPLLSASDRAIVFEVGRSIRSVTPQSHRVRTLAKAAAPPIGLSVEGTRVAWAENVKGRGRIRSLAVPASG